MTDQPATERHHYDRVMNGNPTDSEDYVGTVVEVLQERDAPIDVEDDDVRIVLAVLDDLGVGPKVARVRLDRIADLVLPPHVVRAITAEGECANFGELPSCKCSWAGHTTPPTQADLLGMLDDVVIAAGEHQKGIADVASARRLLNHSELEQALAAREVAQASYQRTVAALRTAITTAVQA